MANISEFYKRLREICEENNLTVNELAQTLGLSSGSPTAWKNGAVPRAATVEKIAAYFGVSVDRLLSNEIKKAPTETGERDILDEIDIGFYGAFKELSEDDKSTVRDMVMLMRKRRAEQEK